MSNSYIDGCLEFAGNLKGGIFNSLTVRLSPHDYGWGQAARWRDRYPLVSLDLGQAKIIDLLRETKLAVYTYNQTGYLETITLNVPTILFWDKNKSSIRDSAEPYFQDLFRVGIFHNNPISAALHISNIWNDVDTWWGSNEVQEVLASFKKRYCYQPENILDKIEAIISDAIEEKP